MAILRGKPRPGQAATLAALLALGASGCERTDPVAVRGGPPVLTGVVVASADSAFVTVGRLDDRLVTQPVPGALLSLLLPGGRVALEAGPPGGCGDVGLFACYRGRLPSPAAPGDEVLLEGRLADGMEVGGRTVLPRPSSVAPEGAGPDRTVRASGAPEELILRIEGLEEAPGRVVVADTLIQVELEGPGGPWGCTLRPSPTRQPDLREVPGGQVGFERVFCSDGTRRVERPWNALTFAFSLLVYDVNFTAWARAGDGLAPAEASFGTTGIAGVFGSATPRRFVVVLTR